MRKKFKIIKSYLMAIWLIEAISMIPSFIYGICQGESKNSMGFLIAIVIFGIIFGSIGIFFLKSIKHRERHLTSRDSYMIVALSWINVILIGSIPYYFSGMGYSIIDSIFESTASWTTCNAWVIDIDLVPKSLLLWKATCNWLGGMGVVFLTMMIISDWGSSAQKLVTAESPGPQLAKNTPRMIETVKFVYGIYVLLTCIEVLLLYLGGISFFDSLINTMSSISTAGLIDYKGGIGSNFTPYVKIVLIFFSLVASVNFIVYVKLARGKLKDGFKDFEVRFFLSTLLIASIVIAIILRCTAYNSLYKALIDGATSVISFGTTTGFNVQPIYHLPASVKLILLCLMLIGGCSNSTCGGLKVIRVALMFKLIHRDVFKRIHPRAVKPVMIRNEAITAESATGISAYILLFFAVYLLSVLVFSIENLDLETTFTAPLAFLSNTGIGYGLISKGQYYMLSGFSKIYACLLMLGGRLEIYALLMLFTKSFWNVDRIK